MRPVEERGRQGAQHAREGETGENRVVHHGERGRRVVDTGELRGKRRGNGANEAIAAAAILLPRETELAPAWKPARAGMERPRHALAGRPDTEGEIERRVREAWARGATEVCMQGGIHPSYTGAKYLDICRAVKSAAPAIHIHAFSPLEVHQGAATLGVPVESFLRSLQATGLGTLPGTAAEILDDEVRAVLCPDKIRTSQWLEVMRQAHRSGLRSTATIMFGHVDRYEHWARHLLRIRQLQEETGGFTEFVPLPFVHMEAPIYLKGRSRRGPTFREAVLMHAIARLALHPLITNVQTSWVKMGRDGVQTCLRSGANDLGGTLMDETITRSAGASHGQEMTPVEMERIIRSLGRVPRQRDTLYRAVPQERYRASFGAMRGSRRRAVAAHH